MSQQVTLNETHRIMTICNACRYCEGFCAVWPAMELHRGFKDSDLKYLANLCHNCRGCYYACQYAPPHEFNLNAPQTLAKLRKETYEEFAWPRPLAKLFTNNGLHVFWISLLSIIVFMFINVKSMWLRLLSRVLLVPIIAGISYEFIMFAGRIDSKRANILSVPGMWVQRLTTKEPDLEMCEVAIRSVEAVIDWRAYQDAMKRGEIED